MLLLQFATGGVSSTTLTICVHVAVLPDPSVTVQITVVSPIGKTAGASLPTEATEQLSLVAGVPKTTEVAVQLLLATTVTGIGHVIEGGVTSLKVTLNVEETVTN